MSPALYGAFVAAVVALMLIPGPNVALIDANSLARGPRAGLATVAGTWTAMVPQLVATALGMGALLAGAAPAFGGLRWLGVAYLLWLAFRAFTAPADDDGVTGPQDKPLRALFLRGFLVSLANPKTRVFYAAFFPQFLSPRAPLAPQLFLLCATFLALAAIVDCGWALLAAHAGDAFCISARTRNNLTGGLLLGAGLGLIRKA